VGTGRATQLAPIEDQDLWLSAADLAELALPGLPGDKRSIARRAKDERWHGKADAHGRMLVRPRSGQGGGHEFHASILPPPAQLELARRGLIETASESEPRAEDRHGWRWFEQQTAKVRKVAEFRLQVVGEIEVLEAAGATRTAAVAEIAAERSLGKSTLWNWLRAVDGVAPANRLPALAPRRRGGGAQADIDPLLWTAFKSDYLRPSKPTLTSCYERTAAIAAAKGIPMPSERTFRRRLDTIDPGIITLKRKGAEALRRSIPAQRRTIEHLHALEHVNVDGHRFDVFVKDAEGRVFRPMMVAIQDIYSSKIVGWRLAEAESAVLTRLAFADCFREFGIPKHCTLDNGRAFASKWITGGAKSRYRFKIREEEPTGLLTGLGIEIHWALPYRGQSKPIERAFRDMCDRIAKHPAMEGAYTGNSPMAKPENYGSRAVPMDEFIVHVAQGIAAHNARLGRRGRNYAGRSFDQVFEESYAAAPIGKATAEQLRMALLSAEQVLVNRTTGEISLFGNRYWSAECGSLHGQRVTVRFDPDNLNEDIHLYAKDGRYLTSAQVIDDTGFDDVAGAKATAKRLKGYRQLIRDAAAAEGLMDAEQVAAMQPGTPMRAVPNPGAVRPVRHRGTAGAAAAAVKTHHEEQEDRQSRVFNALRLVTDNDQ
jgi:putative transposase